MLQMLRSKSRTQLFVLMVLAIFSSLLPHPAPAQAPQAPVTTDEEFDRMLGVAPTERPTGITGLQPFVQDKFDAGNIAWILVGSLSALFLITPGLLLFHCELMRSRNVTVLMTRYLLFTAIMSMMWVLWGYSISFARNVHSFDVSKAEILAPNPERTSGNRFIGGFDHVGLRGLVSQIGTDKPMYPLRHPHDKIPHLLFMAYHMMFFIAVPVPLVVVLANRLGWTGVASFILLWGTLVYAPLAYWTWGGGWQANVLDSAGGIPAHISVGVAAVAAAVLLRKQPVQNDAPPRANSFPSLVIGTVLFCVGSLLWNSSRSLAADGYAANSFVTTYLAGCAGVLTWAGLDWARHSRVKPPGICFGCVTGLIAVSSASGFVAPQSGIVIGVIGVIASYSVHGILRSRIARNSPMKVFIFHAVPAAAGLLLTGVFATSAVAGLDRHGTPIVGVIGGNVMQLATQAYALGIAAVLAFVGSFASLFFVRIIASFSRAKATSGVLAHGRDELELPVAQ